MRKIKKPALYKQRRLFSLRFVKNKRLQNLLLQALIKLIG